MANDAIPFYEDGDELTALATAAVLGKRFVVVSGDKPASGEAVSAAPAGAGARALGVSMFDAPINKRFTVHTIDSGDVIPVTLGANVAANQSVTSDAVGQAVPAAPGTPALGFALTGGVTGADGVIKLSYHTAP